MRLGIYVTAAIGQASLAQAAVSLMRRHVLPTAVCTDGSPGHYYMATNASSKDYVVFLQGGMGCAHNLTHCEDLKMESPPLFTSIGFPDEIAAYGMLSGDAGKNALFSTFNRIYVPYCSMDLYLLDTESPDGEMQFRGRPLLEETLTEVLGSAAHEATIVLGGSSAGGIGAFNAARWILETFPQVSELSVVLDSALFFDVHGYLSPLLDYIKQNPTVAYSSHCEEAFDGGPCCAQLGCMFQRGHYPMSDPRLRGTFALNPLQDGMPAYQIAQLGTYDEDTLPTFWDAATYTGEVGHLLRNLAALYPGSLSVFSPSCTDHSVLTTGEANLHHCLEGLGGHSHTEYYDVTCVKSEGHAIGRIFEGDASLGMRWKYSQMAGAWDTLKIDGTSVREAIETWWAGRGVPSQQVHLFDECDDINCNPTCSAEVLPGLRDESESPLVWFIVSVTLFAAAAVLGGAAVAVVWGCTTWRQVQAIVAARAKEEEELREKEEPITKAPKLTRSPSLSDLRLRQAGRPGYDGSTTPILEWQSLSYWVPQRGSSKGGQQAEKQLLHSVDGAIPEGALCALMGPSGSGKSTLLDLLTGRRAVGRCEGELFFEGRSIVQQQDSYILKSGYMRQDNTGFLDGLTVFDNLVYACMLRMPGSLEAQISRVETVIEETALLRSRDTKAGSLSGGQKRRLTLALELLADRRILFLDEPTSGLDATASLDLLRILKRLARKVTLVVAIHQPRPEIWRLFSHIILLKSGRTVYCGPPARAIEQVSKYIPTTTSSSGRILTRRVLRHRGSLSPTPSVAVSDSAISSMDYTAYPRSPASSAAALLSGPNTTDDDKGYDGEDGTQGDSGRYDEEDMSDSYSSCSDSGIRDRGNTHVEASAANGASSFSNSVRKPENPVQLEEVAPSSTVPQTAAVAKPAGENGKAGAEAGASPGKSSGSSGSGSSRSKRGRKLIREERICRGLRRPRPQIIPVTSSRESPNLDNQPDTGNTVVIGKQATPTLATSSGASLKATRTHVVSRNRTTVKAAGRKTVSGGVGRKHVLARRDPAGTRGTKVRKGPGGARRPAGVSRGRLSDRVITREQCRAEKPPDDDGDTSSSFSFVSYSPSRATSITSSTRASPRGDNTLSGGGCFSSACATPASCSPRRATSLATTSTVARGDADARGGHSSSRVGADDGDQVRRAGGVFSRRDLAFDSTRPFGSSSSLAYASDTRTRRQKQQLSAAGLTTEDEDDAASADNMDWRTSSQRCVQRSKPGGRSLTLPQLLGDAQRSVPDKILDLLVTIRDDDLAQMQAKEAQQTPKRGLVETQRGRDALSCSSKSSQKREDSNDVGGVLVAAAAALIDMEAGRGNRYLTNTSREEEKRECFTVKEECDQEYGKNKDGKKRAGTDATHGKRPRTAHWKVAAILLARSGKSGYAMEMLAQFGILESAILLMAASFRVARGESAMFHLIFSVLLTMVMPVLLMYHPVLIPKMWDEWTLARTELADGFYPSVCVTLRVAFDHLAIGVLASFSVVSVMHIVLWDDVISALPVSSIGVNAQLSCGVMLMAWVMIALFDALTISGMKLTHVFTIGVSLSAVWAFYSGTVMLITSLPEVLKVVSYTSPHFWSTSFMLRIILDGLDMSSDCAYDSPLYCATSYGDLIADGLGLHERVTSLNVVVMVMFTAACVMLFVLMVEIRGRRRSIFGGLLQEDILEWDATCDKPQRRRRRQDRRDRIACKDAGAMHPKDVAKKQLVKDGIRLSRASSYARRFSANAKRGARRREQQVGPSRGTILSASGSSGARSLSADNMESGGTNNSINSPATSTASAATTAATAATAAVSRAVVAVTRNATASLTGAWATPRSPLRFTQGDGGWWSSGNGEFAGASGAVAVARPDAGATATSAGAAMSANDSEHATPLPSPPPASLEQPLQTLAPAIVAGGLRARESNAAKRGERVRNTRRERAALGSVDGEEIAVFERLMSSRGQGLYQDSNMVDIADGQVRDGIVSDAANPMPANPLGEYQQAQPGTCRKHAQDEQRVLHPTGAVSHRMTPLERIAAGSQAARAVAPKARAVLHRGYSTPIPASHTRGSTALTCKSPLVLEDVDLNEPENVNVVVGASPDRRPAATALVVGSTFWVDNLSTPPAYGAE